MKNIDKQEYINQYIKPKLELLRSRMVDGKKYPVTITKNATWIRDSVSLIIEWCDLSLWEKVQLDDNAFARYLETCNEVWKQVKDKKK